MSGTIGMKAVITVPLEGRLPLLSLQEIPLADLGALDLLVCGVPIMGIVRVGRAVSVRIRRVEGGRSRAG